MAWYTGKAAIAICAIGDSNIVANAEGADSPSERPENANVYCYAKPADGAPYGNEYLEWLNLNDNDASRDLDLLYAFLNDQPFVGQALGGRENSSMQLGSSVQQDTGIDTYVYQCGRGGSTAADWLSGNNWDTLLDTVPTALAAIPGTPTAFDIIYISLGTNDVRESVSGQEFYLNIRALRALMIAEGWWIPETTQIVMMDLPRTGDLDDGVKDGGANSYPDTWRGLDYVTSKLNDRIAANSSVGLGYGPIYPVHHSEAAYTDLGIQASDLVVARIAVNPAKWWSGKATIAAASIGDSNAFGSGGYTPAGGQTQNTNVLCYASATGQVPYSEANLGWRTLDPNGTARTAEYASYIDTAGNIGFIGQALGGNGNAAMQMGSTFREGSDAENLYLYQCAAGGTTADFWANGDGWDTLLRTIPTALTTIPSAPTYFDIIYISLGTNDCNQDYTAEQYCANMKLLRNQMVAEGWWVPGTTRIALMDLPRNGSVSGTAGDYPDTWAGIDYFLSRFNDRIDMVKSYGMDYDPDWGGVHYEPPSYTSMGLRTGELLLADIPKRQAVYSIGGVALSVSGARLRVNSA